MSTNANFTALDGFGARLRAERDRLGMTQEQLGEAGGVRRATQWLYEQGERTPSVEYLARISAAGVDFKYVLIGTRSAQTGGMICLQPDLLRRIFLLVDAASRDDHGQLLDPQHRVSLMLAICQSVAESDAESVDLAEVLDQLTG